MYAVINNWYRGWDLVYSSQAHSKINTNKEFLVGISAENVVDSTSCTYPFSDPEKKEDRYITFYDKSGIACRKEGETQYEWFIEFEDESQYEKVMEFLNSIDSQDNLRYACHENFWRDFLDDNIDMEGFRDFLDTRVSNGIPNYLDWTEDTARINETAVQWAKYMNKPGEVNHVGTTRKEPEEWNQEHGNGEDEFGGDWGSPENIRQLSNITDHEKPDFVKTMYTTQELIDMMDQILEEKQKEGLKEGLWYTSYNWAEHWNKEHPDLVGKKCLYVKGAWRTAEEVQEIEIKEFEEELRKRNSKKKGEL